jgi:hypothetical protein
MNTKHIEIPSAEESHKVAQSLWRPYKWPALMPYYREWRNQARPKYFRHQRERGKCFNNAAQTVLDHPKLTYCEGEACAFSNGIFLTHAWVIDGEGRVIDQTWDYLEDRHYIGVPLTVKWLWDASKESHAWGSTLWKLQRLIWRDGFTDLSRYVRLDLVAKFNEMG